jgi:hypothetical protein
MIILINNLKMFSWNENVAISLISVIRDPELVLYFMSILKPMRRDFVEDEAREWHKSLRITQQERWERVAKLSRQRKFSHMNASVPITCTLPFDGGMWRNSKELLKMIRYFRKGFIREIVEVSENMGYERIKSVEEKLSKKIKIVNLVNNHDAKGSHFRLYYTLGEIEEALDTLIEYENYPKPDWSWEEFPYIAEDHDSAVSDGPTYIAIIN